MKDAPWYRRWFGEEYLHLYPHRDLQEAALAVDLLLESVPLRRVDRVLDLACGSGRHMKALHQRGIRTTGLDLSHALLLRAGLAVPGAQLVRGDMRNLPFPEGVFSAVSSFFTSFGYFEDELDDRAVLGEVRRVLRRGGYLLLDFLNADRVRESLEASDERVVEGQRVIQDRALEDDGRIVRKQIRISAEGEEPRVFMERVRLYEAEELESMLSEQRLEPVARFGGYDGAPPSSESPRVIILAQAG